MLGDFEYALCFGIVGLVIGVCVLLKWTSPKRHPRSFTEGYFVDPFSERDEHNKNTCVKRYKIPVMAAEAGQDELREDELVDLSFVIPAYNEQDRLPIMIEELEEYLEERIRRFAETNARNKRIGNNPVERTSGFKYEIIIVDDGSTDMTIAYSKSLARSHGNDIVKILKLDQNGGKGRAVRLGMMSARGRRILMVDADGASRMADLDKLENALDIVVGESLAEASASKGKRKFSRSQSESYEMPAIAIGSRAHMVGDAVAKRTLLRTILMYGFHMVVYIFCVKTVKDTQCGFKLLTRGAVRKCVSSMHVERWAFDAELLFIAESLKIPIREIAINWQEIAGSKLPPIQSAIQMGKDLVLIRLYYTLGIWKIANGKKYN
eukprot:Nk52_evm22s352 gene=Nk52_evmTU22s352